MLAHVDLAGLTVRLHGFQLLLDNRHPDVVAGSRAIRPGGGGPGFGGNASGRHGVRRHRGGRGPGGGEGLRVPLIARARPRLAQALTSKDEVDAVCAHVLNLIEAREVLLGKEEPLLNLKLVGADRNHLPEPLTVRAVNHHTLFHALLEFIVVHHPELLGNPSSTGLRKLGTSGDGEKRMTFQELCMQAEQARQGSLNLARGSGRGRGNLKPVSALHALEVEVQCPGR